MKYILIMLVAGIGIIGCSPRIAPDTEPHTENSLGSSVTSSPAVSVDGTSMQSESQAIIAPPENVPQSIKAK